MNLSLFVVRVQGNADVSFSFPFGSYFVVVFQCCFEMERMFLTIISDTKIINYERELNGAPIVCLEAWKQLALLVAMLVESFFEELVGQEPGVR